MTSIVFPGQGSQFIGMSKDFYDNFSSSKLVIDEIEDITSISIKNIMFEDSKNQIDLTQYTQICIFAASISIFRAISENFNLEDFKISYMFGHSLGEYSALAASNKISINNASKLLKMRGEFMQNAIAPNTSTMAAIIGLSSKQVENIINNSDLKIHIANDNSNQQVVISGLIKDIENSKKIFENHGAKKFVI
jgi:(acyl-carrier-protein) S-malonyltransferase